MTRKLRKLQKVI